MGTRNSRFTLLVMLAAVIIGGSATRANRQTKEPTSADWAWLNAHRGELFDKFMPLQHQVGEFVTFRSYRDLHYNVIEQYFQIWFVPNTGDPPLTATVVRPVGRSLQQQSLDLHMADRGASAAKIYAKLQVERRELSEANCPVLRKRLEALETLRFGLPARDLIALHATGYEILISYGGGYIHAELVEGDHALVRWALETNAQLGSCLQKTQGK